MDPITLGIIEIGAGLAAAALLGGVLGYFLRGARDRRGGARSGATAAPGGSATGPATAGPGLRSVHRPAQGSGGIDAEVVGRDPWRDELPPDVEESLRAAAGSSGTTVLVVDDRLELRAVHSTYLQQHGYTVLTAADGETALDIVRTHRPAVVLLDHSLPRMSGLDVTRELKADPRTSRIPVILMTAHSYGAIGMAARQAGVSAFLPKPVDPSRVLREIERHTGIDVHDA